VQSQRWRTISATVHRHWRQTRATFRRWRVDSTGDDPVRRAERIAAAISSETSIEETREELKRVKIITEKKNKQTKIITEKF
jgi:hypothetical protein